MPAFQPYWGKPAVRNDREGRGNVGIIRSPIRASIPPDHNALLEQQTDRARRRALFTFGHHEALSSPATVFVGIQHISALAFRRHNLTTNFAVWIGLCMNVDVPLSRRQLLGLFCSECRLPLDRTRTYLKIV